MRQRAKDRASQGKVQTSVKDILAEATERLKEQEDTIRKQQMELQELRESMDANIAAVKGEYEKRAARLEKRFEEMEKRIALKVENIHKKVRIAKDQNTILEAIGKKTKSKLDVMSEQLELLTVEVLGEEDGAGRGDENANSK